MSILDNASERIVVYPAVETFDADGNSILHAADTGIETRGSLQARGLDTDPATAEGYATTETYRLRLARSFTIPLGPGAEIEARGQRFAVVTKPVVSRSSPMTTRTEYMVRRS